MKKYSRILALLSLLILTACFGGGSETDEGEDRAQEIQFPMPENGEIRHPTGGLEQWFAIGAITGVPGRNVNGVAQAHYFEKGLFLHTIQANIEPAEDGFFYEGWLSNGVDVKSTGHLVNTMGDSRHSLQFEISDDLREHLQVLITKEADDGNPEPGTKIAEAVLKVTPR